MTQKALQILASSASAASCSASALMPGKVLIDVVSDTVCPWCWIGKRRLETAMRNFEGQMEFEVRWHPFQLNPAAPAEGVDKLQHYKEKFGERRVQSMVPAMTETFAREGLAYTMEGKTGNTFDSHRLIALAGKQGGPRMQDRMVEALFKSYFSEGKFINDPEVLQAAAEKAGLANAKAAIQDKFVAAQEVNDDLRTLARGVTGVPHFVINGKYQLSGAQDPSAFEQVFASL